jgi:hypothetical protein
MERRPADGMVEIDEPAPSRRETPPGDRRRLVVALALAIVVIGGVQLLPTGEPGAPGTERALPDPGHAGLQTRRLTASLTEGNIEWTAVAGLAGFDTLAGPVRFGDMFLAIGNPTGVGTHASAVVSNSGEWWREIGTLPGIGGEVEVVDLQVYGDTLVALGTYSPTIPATDLAPRLRYPAVWKSNDGGQWASTALPESSWLPERLVVSPHMVFAIGRWTTERRLASIYERLPPSLRDAIDRGDLMMQDGSDAVEVIAPPWIRVASYPLPPDPGDNEQQGTAARSAQLISWQQVPSPFDGPSSVTFLPGPAHDLLAIQDRSIMGTIDGVTWENREVDAQLLLNSSSFVPAGDRLIGSSGGSLIIRRGPQRTMIDISSLLPPGSSVHSGGSSELLAMTTSTWVPYQDVGGFPGQPPAGTAPFQVQLINNQLVIADGGSEVASWPLVGPIPGSYDAADESVTIIDSGGNAYRLLLSDLRSLAPGLPAIDDHPSTLLVSGSGQRWVAGEVPLAGQARVAGVMGSAVLVQVKEAGSVSYLLAVPAGL